MAKIASNPQYYITQNSTIASGGSGYVVNDILTATGGTFVTAFQIQVLTVTSGAITTFAITNVGNYSVLPSNAVTLTASTGVGIGATLTAVWVATNPGFTTISHYGSNTASVMPQLGTLANRELFVNTADLAIYTRNGSGNLVTLVSATNVADTAIVFAIALGG